MVKKYKDGITIITPTGDRLTAFTKCVQYVNRQTLLPNQWIICDDGKGESASLLLSKINSDIKVDYIRRQHEPNQKKSFTGNVLSIIETIENDNIIVIEDDDWYHKKYIERTNQRLRDVVIAGQSRAIYYNIQFRRYRINNNDKRASFCETAFKSRLLPKLKKYCYPRTSAFIDSRLWYHCRRNKLPNRLFQDERLCVGIKGMPGRSGIGIGHRPGLSYIKDPKWQKLIELIGEEDARFYQQIAKTAFK